MTSRDNRWLEVTRSDVICPEVTWKWLRRLKTFYTLHFTSCKTVARSRTDSHRTENYVTWPQVSGSDLEVTSFDRKSPGSGYRNHETHVYCTFHFKAVAQGGRQSRDRKCHVTSGYRKSPGSDVTWPKVSWKWL